MKIARTMFGSRDEGDRKYVVIGNPHAVENFGLCELFHGKWKSEYFNSRTTRGDNMFLRARHEDPERKLQVYVLSPEPISP